MTLFLFFARHPCLFAFASCRYYCGCRMQWTFYPNGEGPVTVHVTCSGLLIRDDHVDDDHDDPSTTSAAAAPTAQQSTARRGNQRLAMLVEGDTPKADAEIDKSALRGVEMLRHLPVPVCQFDLNGQIMYQNPEAAHVFGATAAATSTASTLGDENDTHNKNNKENATSENKENDDQRSSSCDFLQRFENKELGRRILKTVLQDGHDFQDEVLQYARSTNTTSTATSAPTSSSGAETLNGADATTTAITAPRPRWFSVKCRRSKDPVTAEPVLLYSARDLTDLKKMDALVLAKNEFVATMAHEIRTPLFQVQGFLELLSSTKHQMTAFQQENVAYMENSALSLSTVVNDILDYSKLEIGHMKLECIPFEMNSAVATSIAAIRSKALAKSIQIRHYFNNNNHNNNMDDGDNHTSSNTSDNHCNGNDDNANIPRLVVGDPNRIRQILLNLLQNAVKFTPEHGHISLLVTRIRNDHDTSNSGGTGLEHNEVGGIPTGNQQQDDSSFTPRHNPNNMSRKSNDSIKKGTSSWSSAVATTTAMTTAQQQKVRLRFEVVDDGIGIHPDRLDDIFNKYQQADASIARQFGGTGLGLSICKLLFFFVHLNNEHHSIFRSHDDFGYPARPSPSLQVNVL
jgi:signal transduction histidine kinase